MILWKRKDFGEMFDAFTMELDHLPWAGPNALPAVCTPLVDDADFCFHQLDGILGANADTTSAEITLARNNVDHQRCVTSHRPPQS